MSIEAMKEQAARAALTHVRDGMKLGIGTGSTAEHFVRALAEAVTGGLEVIGVPTSERTAGLCVELGVPLATLDDEPVLDLVIDGADEIDPALNLVKGGGGALLREKIVAYASARMIVIADETKLVAHFGRFPLPIEVNRFGLEATLGAIAARCREIGAEGDLSVRADRDGNWYVTDGGHYIVDASFGHISDPEAVSTALHGIPGVVEHGLFLGMADLAIIAGQGGVRDITAPRR